MDSITTDVKHPHFDYVEGAATEAYHSKAMNQTFVLQQRGASHGGHRCEADEVVAFVAMRDGTLPDLQQEPFAWGPDVWDCLDAIHARR